MDQYRRSYRYSGSIQQLHRLVERAYAPASDQPGDKDARRLRDGVEAESKGEPETFKSWRPGTEDKDGTEQFAKIAIEAGADTRGGTRVDFVVVHYHRHPESESTPVEAFLEALARPIIEQGPSDFVLLNALTDDTVDMAFGSGSEEPGDYAEQMHHWYYGDLHLINQPYFDLEIDYEHALVDFQTVMNRLARKYQWGYLARTGERLYIESGSTSTEDFARWDVHSRRPEQYDDGSFDVRVRIGTIEAHAEPNGHTTVLLFDGGSFDKEGRKAPNPPIGEAFTEFISAIKDEIPGAVVVQQAGHPSDAQLEPRASAEPQAALSRGEQPEPAESSPGGEVAEQSQEDERSFRYTGSVHVDPDRTLSGISRDPTAAGEAGEVGESRRTAVTTSGQAIEAPGKPASPPPQPDEPAQGDPMDAWFRWYQESKDAGYNVTLKTIADKTGYSPSTVGKKHAKYEKRQQQNSE